MDGLLRDLLCVSLRSLRLDSNRKGRRGLEEVIEIGSNVKLLCANNEDVIPKP